MNISSKDKQVINQLIEELEKKSHCEIVPMIVRHSDIYPAAHFRAAIIVSFLFSLALYFSPLNIINPIYFLWIQIPGLFFGYYLGHFPVIKKLLITQDEMNREVDQKGFEAFFNHNLHLTKNHNGVLILVSVMERKIKIIADTGISKKVEQSVWNEIIFKFAVHIREGDFVGGLTQSIREVASVLETHFPAQSTADNLNELHNDLIVEE